jgi:hypothetical protein
VSAAFGDRFEADVTTIRDQARRQTTAGALTSNIDVEHLIRVLNEVVARAPCSQLTQ